MNSYLNVSVVIDEQNPGLDIQSSPKLDSNLSFQACPLSFLYLLCLKAPVKCLLLLTLIPLHGIPPSLHFYISKFYLFFQARVKYYHIL